MKIIAVFVFIIALMMIILNVPEYFDNMRLFLVVGLMVFLINLAFISFKRG